MTTRVPSDEIELLVGIARHESKHYACAVSDDQTVFILHSRACLDRGIDLRACDFSLALDRGIDDSLWTEDTPLVVEVVDGELLPEGVRR